MKKEDLQVQRALAKAGFENLPAGSRGELLDTLAQILRQNPEAYSDLVDQQRAILEKVMHVENVAEINLLKARNPFVKACPECGQRPDFGPGYSTAKGVVLVVCMNHTDSAVTQGGDSLQAALDRWNADDWFPQSLPREHFLL
ncbi:hypothetical protein [Pseudomonas kitaguniensis]|uniref:hypothetical protein n=1 Tax=Pseudomonas kitaguniensis TaxID=2607908 RepID=UPI003BA34CEC